MNPYIQRLTDDLRTSILEAARIMSRQEIPDAAQIMAIRAATSQASMLASELHGARTQESL